jgi:hypothetical protein
MRDTSTIGVGLGLPIIFKLRPNHVLYYNDDVFTIICTIDHEKDGRKEHFGLYSIL